MTKMPEEIWARPGYSDVGEGCYDIVPLGDDAEYVHKDKVDGLVEALRELKKHDETWCQEQHDIIDQALKAWEGE